MTYTELMLVVMTICTFAWVTGLPTERKTSAGKNLLASAATVAVVFGVFYIIHRIASWISSAIVS